MLQTAGIYSQNFTVAEMEKIATLNEDEFETFVMERGYEFVKFDKDTFADSLIFGFDKENRNQYEHYIARHKFNQKDRLMISFQTYKTEYYLGLKKQLKSFGYKFVGTETSDDGTYFLNYKKNGMSFSLASIQANNNSGQKFTSYEISLTKSN